MAGNVSNVSTAVIGAEYADRLWDDANARRLLDRQFMAGVIGKLLALTAVGMGPEDAREIHKHCGQLMEFAIANATAPTKTPH